MSFKILIKLIVFLATLFVFLYIGAYNKQPADFNFPILWRRSSRRTREDLFRPCLRLA